MREGLRAAALAILASLACTAGAATIVVTDDRGRQVAFDHVPTRIVSLLPSITESVCALGACERLVGTDNFSNMPASVRTLPKLGGLEDTQVERLAALQPDVVLAAKSARVTDRLEALGFKVVLLETQTHADAKRTLAVIARLLDRSAEADRVWDAVERDVSTAAARVPPDLRGRTVYFEIAAPYAAGAGSFIGETLARLGMGNVVPAALGPFPRLSPEFVVRADPDVIMAARRQLTEMHERPGWNKLDAFVRGRTCGFATDHYEVIVRPGPRLGEAALILADCLAALPVDTAR